MTAVTSISSVQTFYGNNKTGFKTKTPACYGKPVLDVLEAAFFLTPPFQPQYSIFSISSILPWGLAA